MDWLNKEYSIELHNPLTEEERDAILDVDMEHTTSVEFTTKHGRKVEFAKVRHGRWIPVDPDRYDFATEWCCSECDKDVFVTWYGKECDYGYCPNCGARVEKGDL